ncbi:transporter [Lacisediminihabitans changchengi]|uniref:Transporter n=1 Tax=Lacisediminihabitans changchengi TaxID=2787634 RepID=A0A934SQW3_9MICO|nr:transporter [Lacisediminihabitans changchengi]MBK4347393.1 transporter [Lacisediminihabitans changchengi]
MSSTNLAAPVSGQRIPLNTLAIGFGVAGVAELWTVTVTALEWPSWIPEILWAITLVVWLWLLIAHTYRGSRSADTLASQLRHPAQGPIAAIVPLIGMLLGEDLHRFAPVPGQIVVALSIAAAAGFATWLISYWLSGALELTAIHGGYFLPTVAAGFVASATAQSVGFHAVAVGAFAIAVFFWGVIFTLLIARLAFRPALPGPLMPTLAILVAPPTVGGSAWFSLTGQQPGTVAYAFAGLAVLMILLQIALIPRFRVLSFSLGFWSFTFPYTAVSSYAVEWLEISRPAGWVAYCVAILVIFTGFVVAIAVRTLMLTIAGRRAQEHTGERQLQRANDQDAASVRRNG